VITPLPNYQSHVFLSSGVWRGNQRKAHRIS